MTPGKYLFFTGLIYFIVGMTNTFVYHFTEIEYIQFAWIIILSLPLVIPAVSRWVGVNLLWK